mgnify:CR=1
MVSKRDKVVTADLSPVKAGLAYKLDDLAICKLAVLNIGYVVVLTDSYNSETKHNEIIVTTTYL